MEEQSSSNNLLFKSNYKFIEFKKTGEQLIERQIESTEDIKSFYKDVVEIDDGSNTATKSSNIINKQEVPMKIKSNCLEKQPLPTKKEYLKALQNADLNTVKAFLSNSEPSVLNLKDQFGWNALMIATAAGNTQIVKFLLEQTHSDVLFDELLACQDLAGNNAEAIASRTKNLTIVEMIRKSRLAKRVKSPELIILDAENEEKHISETNFCETCQIEYKSQAHFTSITHIVSTQSVQPIQQQNISYNYHLQSDNKGYQLLCKSGWENKRGLGKSEQGTVFPVKATQKLDRQGLGIEPVETESKFKVNKKRVKIERCPNPERIETNLKEFKYADAKRRRDKLRERRLRNEFNR